ncbi:MAG: HAMP domain-containing protein [Acidobacteria bacterium]|nr:MAG: HAMP domain-containing protein [Acidobacteriota bacterium]
MASIASNPSFSRGLRARIVLLTMAGTLSAIAIFGWLSWSAVQALGKQVLKERMQLAISVAASVDLAVNSELALLERISPASGAAGPRVEQAALREAYVRSRFLTRDFVLGLDGRIVQAEPSFSSDTGAPSGLPAFREAVERGRPEISALSDGTGATRRLFLFVPLRDAQNRVAGIIGGEIDPQAPAFRGLLNFVPLGERETVDLVDQRGVIIASTAEERLYTRSDHRDFLAKLIKARQPAAGTCHGCHQSGPTKQRVDEVMAFAPLLSRASWGTNIRQPRVQAFSTVVALRRRILIWGPALALLSLAFALGAASSITAPLSKLVGTARHIAAGELEIPVPDLGSDEVGQLGRALERMRTALRQSQQDVARGRDQLELRIQERTAEIEKLYDELKQRDQLRAMLLKKVIRAQEEERRRIARELHDETSQVIGALALELDTAVATLPEGVSRERLLEARAIAVRTLDGIHRLSFDLRPSVLDDLGLFRAIKWYAERDLKKRGIAVRCETDEEDTRLSPEIETALFRAVQEAITNIVKHSGADAVLIQCATTPGAVTIEIEDDGRGFDQGSISDTAATGRGLGLAGIQERMEILGGKALIDSAPGRGTRVVLTVPRGERNA